MIGGPAVDGCSLMVDSKFQIPNSRYIKIRFLYHVQDEGARISARFRPRPLEDRTPPAAAPLRGDSPDPPRWNLESPVPSRILLVGIWNRESGIPGAFPDPPRWNLESGIWNLESPVPSRILLVGIWNRESGILNPRCLPRSSSLESGIWNPRCLPGSSSLESGIWNLESGIPGAFPDPPRWNLESGIWNLESGIPGASGAGEDRSPASGADQGCGPASSRRRGRAPPGPRAPRPTIARDIQAVRTGTGASGRRRPPSVRWVAPARPGSGT